MSLVGASGKDTALGSEGVVYTIQYEAGSWVERQSIQPFDGQPIDGDFGHVLAANGDTLAISNSYRQGAAAQVDVLTRAGDTWTHLAELTEPDAPAGIFGYSMSMSESTLLVSSTLGLGRAGVVYVFVRNGMDWAVQATLADPDVGASGIFGSRCFVSEDDAFVGVTDANEMGSVDYFARRDNAWVKVQVLIPDYGTPEDAFGLSMGVSGKDLFVSAPFDDELATDVGAVYVFHRDGQSWMQTQVLLPWNDPIEGDKPHAGAFGYSLAADGDLLLVGALREDTAYVFQRDGAGVWQPAKKLFNRQMTGGGFGGAVALQGRTAIVAAPLEGNASEHTIQNGAVYVFDLEQDAGEACSADSDCASGSCVEGACAEAPGDGGAGGLAGAPGSGGSIDVGASGAPGVTPQGYVVEPNGCACRLGADNAGGGDARGSALLFAVLALGLRLRRSRGHERCSRALAPRSDTAFVQLTLKAEGEEEGS